MKVEIWSDVACPWCYIGKRRFEAATAEFEHRDQLEVVWRSFELDPSAPARREGTPAEHLARKYGTTALQAAQMNSRMSDAAAGDGLAYRLDELKMGNTFDAHRLIHLGAERGVQDAVKERLLAAYLTEGEAISDRETLVRLAAEAGLDPLEARAMLDSGRFTAEVRADEREAGELGINGVPFFVLDRRYGISGAQPPELLLEALRQAWQEAHPPSTLKAVGGPGPVCDDESCEVPQQKGGG